VNKLEQVKTHGLRILHLVKSRLVKHDEVTESLEEEFYALFDD